MGAIHSTKISGNLGLKLNGSVRSNWKSFEKTVPAFEVDHFSRSEGGPVGILVAWIAPHIKCACVTSVINVGRAVQTDPTLLRYASAITEQKKKLGVGGSISDCAQNLPTTPNSMQQGVQTDVTCNIQRFWELLTNNVASVFTWLKSDIFNLGRPMN